MEPSQQMVMQLWSYIDGSLPPAEQRLVEQLIQQETAWKEKYGELLAVQQLMQEIDLEAPSLRFTKNVMEELARISIAPAARNYLNKNIIRGLGLFFVTLLTGFVAYAFSLVDWRSGSGSTSSGFNLDQVDFTRLMDSNLISVFIGINVIAGLMLFDRYLTARKKKWEEQTL